MREDLETQASRPTTWVLGIHRRVHCHFLVMRRRMFWACLQVKPPMAISGLCKVYEYRINGCPTAQVADRPMHGGRTPRELRPATGFAGHLDQSPQSFHPLDAFL